MSWWFAQFSIWLQIGLGIILVGAIFLAVWMFKEYFSIKGHYEPAEDLIGEVGTVKKECTPHQRGKVYIAGAYWNAICEHGNANVGDDVRVTGFNDKFLVVTKIDLIGIPKV